VPTYEYVCQSCGTHVEVYQRFSDEPLTECGVCGGPLRKVFHPAGILFKGSGFYVTDSRAKRSGGDGQASGKDRAPGRESKTADKTSGSGGSGPDGGKSEPRKDKERSA
jgi:putative FmdB family regulatory protein